MSLVSFARKGEKPSVSALIIHASSIGQRISRRSHYAHRGV